MPAVTIAVADATTAANQLVILAVVAGAVVKDCCSESSVAAVDASTTAVTADAVSLVVAVKQNQAVAAKLRPVAASYQSDASSAVRRTACQLRRT